MPQLNPAPWLMIMLISWAVLLTFFSQKVTSALPQNTPLMLDQTTHKPAPWAWPWA